MTAYTCTHILTYQPWRHIHAHTYSRTSHDGIYMHTHTHVPAMAAYMRGVQESLPPRRSIDAPWATSTLTISLKHNQSQVEPWLQTSSLINNIQFRWKWTTVEPWKNQKSVLTREVSSFQGWITNDCIIHWNFTKCLEQKVLHFREFTLRGYTILHYTGIPCYSGTTVSCLW